VESGGFLNLTKEKAGGEVFENFIGPGGEEREEGKRKRLGEITKAPCF